MEVNSNLWDSIMGSKLKIQVEPDVLPVEIDSIRRAFDELFKLDLFFFRDSLIKAFIKLSYDLKSSLRFPSKKERNPDILNSIIIVTEIPLLQYPLYYEEVLPAFYDAISYLSVQDQAKLARAWSTCHPEHLLRLLRAPQEFVTEDILYSIARRKSGVNYNNAFIGAALLMKIIYYASLLGGIVEDSDLTNEKISLINKNSLSKQDPLSVELKFNALDCRKPLLHFEEFYHVFLSTSLEYYFKFLGNEGTDEYSFLLYPKAKIVAFYYRNELSMLREISPVQQNTAPDDLSSQSLKLQVHRDSLIQDALDQVEMVAMENPNNFKKQLVVEFVGEQGIDEGGVSKEFFQLFIEEIFNSDFGMFIVNHETQSFWFNPTSFENDAEFTLIGIVLGLAIYNKVILDVNFPTVLYRKLMGKKGTFYDLKDWDPSLWKGLNELLSYANDDLEEVFMQSFCVTYTDVFGRVLSHNLKGTGNLLVSQSNKEEFVQLYSDFLLNKSIDKQFQAFNRGFQLVTGDSSLYNIFRPEEIRSIVCGCQAFDFHNLEMATSYEGGYTSNSDVIKWFWQIFHGFTLVQHKKLLQYITGSDRVPIGGLKELNLVISRNGGDTINWPTAQTCYNVFLLPEYKTADSLKEKLLTLLNYNKGFGII